MNETTGTGPYYPLLNEGSDYVNREEERRRAAGARANVKHAVFLTPPQMERLIIAVVNDAEGAHPEDHDLYIALINAYERVGGV
jgi:hypothetical protein